MEAVQKMVDRVLENCSAMTIVKVLQGEDLNLWPFGYEGTCRTDQTTLSPYYILWLQAFGFRRIGSIRCESVSIYGQNTDNPGRMPAFSATCPANGVLLAQPSSGSLIPEHSSNPWL